MSESRPTVPARPEPRDPGLSPEEVLDWLRGNPDFIVRHPEALDGMAVPERALGRGVADLQHALIGRLRAELEQTKERQRDLVATGRANLNAQARVHDCMLAMLAASSFEQLIQTVTTDFAVLLDLDVVTLCVEADGAETPRPPGMRGLRVVPQGTVRRLLGDNRAVLLRAEADGEAEIYGGGAPLVASDALARLSVSPDMPPGLIAFGSRKPAKFEPGQAVELLGFLARGVERVIRLWLTLS